MPPPELEAVLLVKVQFTTVTIEDASTFTAPPESEVELQSWINNPLSVTVLLDVITTHVEPDWLPFNSILSNDAMALSLIVNIEPEEGAMITTSGRLLKVTKLNDWLTMMEPDSW